MVKKKKKKSIWVIKEDTFLAPVFLEGVSCAFILFASQHGPDSIYTAATLLTS